MTIEQIAHVLKLHNVEVLDGCFVDEYNQLTDEGSIHVRDVLPLSMFKSRAELFTFLGY